MNSPSQLPDPPGVHRLDRDGIGPLQQQARNSGHALVRIDLGPAANKAGIMAALAKGLRLPETFGANLDALYDCLTDAAFAPQGVVLLEGLHDVPGMLQEDLLDVFADAVAQRSSDAPGLTVYWSC